MFKFSQIILQLETKLKNELALWDWNRLLAIATFSNLFQTNLFRHLYQRLAKLHVYCKARFLQRKIFSFGTDGNWECGEIYWSTALVFLLLKNIYWNLLCMFKTDQWLEFACKNNWARNVEVLIVLQTSVNHFQLGSKTVPRCLTST